MGALTQPGPQLGALGPPPPRSPAVTPEQGFAEWFWLFLRQELAPYPGRGLIVTRMVIAATITMWLIMTFRLPGAAIAAFYTLLLSRDSPKTTLKTAYVVLVAYLLGAVYTLLGVMLFIDYPITHVLWVAASIFLCFFVIKVTTSYVAAAAFAFILTIAIPLWDASASTEVLLVATLWAAGSVTVGLLTTVAVEYTFSLFETEGELVAGLSQRLALVSTFLDQRATKQVTPETQKKLEQLAMVGVSRLRRLAAEASSPLADVAHRSGTISLTGRLVDLSATLLHLDYDYSGDEVGRLRDVSDRLCSISTSIRTGRAEEPCEEEDRDQHPPILFELERATDLLSVSLFASPEERKRTAGASAEEQPPPAVATTFLSDALSNPEHLHYALRGCLAATLCYIIFNAVEWHGLSTSLSTCVITGLSSIGSSRQKQLLRIAGAIVGGLVFGIGAQVYVLPRLDTISGFTVLFVVVTAIAAWFATASPRISYFGLQMALAFYLINLQEFTPQTNLGIARDRVMGIALGLLAMGLVFDVLGSKPAITVMRETFAANLCLLAELAQPWKNDRPAHPEKIRHLRDKVAANFASVNAQADGVLFEIGPSRRKDLSVRERLLDWQPRLRSVYLIQISLVQYRALAPGEVAPAIREAQTEYDQRVAAALAELSARFSPGADAEDRTGLPELHSAYASLEDAIRKEYPVVTPRAQAVLVLCSNLTQVLTTLARQMHAEPVS